MIIFFLNKTSTKTHYRQQQPTHLRHRLRTPSTKCWLWRRFNSSINFWVIATVTFAPSYNWPPSPLPQNLDPQDQRYIDLVNLGSYSYIYLLSRDPGNPDPARNFCRWVFWVLDLEFWTKDWILEPVDLRSLANHWLWNPVDLWFCGSWILWILDLMVNNCGSFTLCSKSSFITSKLYCLLFFWFIS